ncbi:hypothetical protein HYU95_05140 [Candidatus Daviesbacteria bacterium]|nr:hypothetical protein [Candidatus Daviesbacteria bacterium]
MDQKDLMSSSSKNITPVSNTISGVRAKSFKVSTTSLNFEQYAKTIRAYALAGMSFAHIANAGDFLGDLVERGEVDGPLQEGWQKKAGEVVEDESKILAWQNRGEKASLAPQLSAGTMTGNEMVVISRDLTANSSQTTIDVLEGIKVITEENQKLPEPSLNSDLENNPYLKPPPQELKKPA